MEEQKEKKERFTTCPCCGKETLKLPIKVDENELDKYVACMATGEPYTKTYSLYKGAVEVLVTEPSDVVKDKMNLLASKFSFLDEGTVKDIANNFIMRLFTLLPVLSITIKKGEDKPETKDVKSVTGPLLDEALEHIKDAEWLDKAYQRLVDPALVSGVTKTVLDRVVAKHTETCMLLQNSGFDPNFFAGIVQD